MKAYLKEEIKNNVHLENIILQHINQFGYDKRGMDAVYYHKGTVVKIIKDMFLDNLETTGDFYGVNIYEYLCSHENTYVDASGYFEPRIFCKDCGEKLG